MLASTATVFFSSGLDDIKGGDGGFPVHAPARRLRSPHPPDSPAGPQARSLRNHPAGISGVRPYATTLRKHPVHPDLAGNQISLKEPYPTCMSLPRTYVSFYWVKVQLVSRMDCVNSRAGISRAPCSIPGSNPVAYRLWRALVIWTPCSQ